MAPLKSHPVVFQSCSTLLSSFTPLFSILFSSLLPLFFVYPALFHSHLTTPARLILITHFVSLCSALTFASCSCLSASCLFIPFSQDASFPAYFLILSSTQILSLPLLVGFLSLPASATPLPATISISLFPFASLSSPLIPCLSTQWIQEVLSFFSSSMALPLSLIPHLHQLPSHSLSLYPLWFPSLFRSIVFTLTFCSFFIPYPPPLPSSHISIFHTLWHAIPLFSLQGTLLFSFAPLKPSFFLHFHDGYTHI